jgi:hypothetical protein
MTGASAREYRGLAYESSNLMLDRDSSQALGRYEEAALRALQAGRGRARMGQLRIDSGEYAEAVEDWLSAAACFFLSTAKQQVADVLDVLLRLEAEGKFPKGRSDLRAALQERKQALKELDQRVQQFLHRLGPHGGASGGADERLLRFLLEQVRDLPGFAPLHFAISRQASGLGRQDLAAKHLVWAETFGGMTPRADWHEGGAVP